MNVRKLITSNNIGANRWIVYKGADGSCDFDYDWRMNVVMDFDKLFVCDCRNDCVKYIKLRKIIDESN